MSRLRTIAGGAATAALIAGGVVAVALLPEEGIGDTRCAMVTGGAVEYLRFFESECPPDPAGKPGRTWLPAPIVAAPSFDPATQVREDPQYIVGETEVTQDWSESVRAKTPQELDADKDSKISGVEEAILRALCDHENRLRDLEGSGNVTLQQCRNGLKALLP